MLSNVNKVNIFTSFLIIFNELTTVNFQEFLEEAEDTLYLGLNNETAVVESFEIFQKQSLGLFPSNNKHLREYLPYVLEQLANFSSTYNTIFIDPNTLLEEYRNEDMLYIGKEEVSQKGFDLKMAIEDISKLEFEGKTLLVINGLSEVIEKTSIMLPTINALVTANSDKLQVVVLDSMTKVGGTFNPLTTLIKDNINQIVFEGDLQNQRFIDNLPLEVKKRPVKAHNFHSVKDEEFFDIVVPKVKVDNGGITND